MSLITIIHHSGCSKSRCTLELIESKGINPRIVNYLKGELTEDILKTAISALKKRPKEVLRVKDIEALNLNVNPENDDEVIAFILKYPQVLERPIVIKNNEAVIGRPPENVLTLL